jgi:Ca2+-binding RTX toxin-like protein
MASQHIIYDATNGFLYYDPDGNGPQAQVHFATLINHPALTNGDFSIIA